MISFEVIPKILILSIYVLAISSVALISYNSIVNVAANLNNRGQNKEPPSPANDKSIYDKAMDASQSSQSNSSGTALLSDQPIEGTNSDEVTQTAEKVLKQIPIFTNNTINETEKSQTASFGAPPDDRQNSSPGSSSSSSPSSSSGSSSSSSSSSSSQSDSSPPPSNSAIFFASSKSFVSTDPMRISVSPSITNSTSPTISFELATTACKGSFQDKGYDSMDFVFTENGNGHNYTFGALDYGAHKVFVMCAGSVSGFFDFVIVPDSSQQGNSAVGQS